MHEALKKFPRLALAHLPTPLERLPALTAHTGGAEIWVKRDDCTGIALGGNKTRKLEFLLGEARASGADTVITVGGVQSNHARQTAAAAARIGMRCELVLPRVVPREGVDYEQNGNVLLDRLFGAHVFVVSDEAAAAREIQTRLAAAEARGSRAVVHPPGGSTATGVLGYVDAALELVEQLNAGDAPDFERIYVAASTGGTLAGLRVGFELAGRALPVTGVCVAGPADALRDAVARLADEVRTRLGLPSLPAEDIALVDGYLGAGYGVPSSAALDAIQHCARLEGLLLDPVYTGKAMAALLDAVASGESGDGPILFWHTGGAPALFAYRQELCDGSESLEP
jgi:D-cysteine desulfhydrase family pyridoxal phosphate-dependent enzyme